MPMLWPVSGLVVFSLVIQPIISLAPPQLTTVVEGGPRVAGHSASAPYAIGRDSGPNQITVLFQPFTPTDAAETWGNRYGLQLVSYSPAFGRYTFDLPRVSVDPVGADQALIEFPPLSQNSDIRAFLFDNHLTVIKWAHSARDASFPLSDPLVRVALVRLPKVNLHRIDQAKGTWGALLPAHLDIGKVRSWAQASGLELINYDPNTGDVDVYAPGTEVKPPPDTAALLAELQRQLSEAFSKIKPTPSSPGVPGALSVASSSGGVSLSWAAAQGSSAYAVYRSPSVNGNYSYIGQTTTLSFLDTSSPSGTQFYRVMGLRACDASVTDRGGCQSASPPIDLRYATAPSAVVSIPQSATGPSLPGAPTGITGVSVSTGARISWDAVTGASAYAIYRSDSSGGAYEYLGQTTTPGFTDTSAPAGATSYYRVMAMRACDATVTDIGGCQSSQPPFDPRFSTSPLAISVPAATTTTPPDTTTPPVTTTPPPDTTPAPPAPPTLQAAAADGHVALTWSAVIGATGYDVSRTAAGGEPVLLGTTSGTTFTDDGGQPGIAYTYEVVPNMPAGTASVAAGTTTTVWLAASSKPTITQVSPTTTTLTGNVQLRVDGRTGDGTATVTWSIGGNGGWTTIGTNTAQPAGGDPLAWTSTFNWNTLAVGDGAVSLRVSVTDSAGNATQVDQTYQLVNGRPPAPTEFVATAQPSAVALTWQQPAYTDAGSYQLYRDDAAQPLTELAADVRSYVDAQASPGQHTYRLVLRGAQGQLSDTVTATGSTLTGDAPVVVDFQPKSASGSTLQQNAAVSSRILLTATTTTNADVVFEYAPDGGAYSSVGAAVVCQSGRCQADWDTALLVPGPYNVRGRSGAVASPSLRFRRDAPALLPAPVNVSVMVVGGGVLIHWSAPPASAPAAYSIWRRASDNWQLLTRVAGTEFIDTSFAPGMSADYRIGAINSDGQEGAPSAAAHIASQPVRTAAAAQPAQVGTPHGLTALSATGGVALYWISATNARGYSIERAMSSGGPFAALATTAETTFIDRAGPIGGQAFYRVRATSGAQTSAPSDTVSALLVPAVAPASSASSLTLGAASAPASTLVKPQIVLGVTDGSPPNTATLIGRQAQAVISGTVTASVAGARLETEAVGGSWQPLATLSAGTTASGWMAIGNVVTSGLAAGTYSIRAVAVAANGSAVDTTPTRMLNVVHSVLAPQAVQPQIDANQVLVTWTAPATSSAVTYSVYRSDANGGGYVSVAMGITGTSYRDASLPTGQTFLYKVSAVDPVGNESTLSQAASITTPSSWSSPTTELTMPTAIDATALGSGNVEVAAAASAANGVASVTMAYGPSGTGAWVNLPSLPLPIPLRGGPSLDQMTGSVWAGLWNTAGLAGRYDLRVIVTDTKGLTAHQVRTVTFIGSAPRGPPAIGLTINAVPGGLSLTWPADGIDYQIRRSATGTSGFFQAIGESSTGTFNDSSVVPGLTYTYQLWTTGGAATESRTATPAASPGIGAVTPMAGGTVTSADSKAKVAFAPGIATASLAVTVKQSADQASAIQFVSAAYDLTAIDAYGNAVRNFSGMPVLTIQYAASGPTPTAIYYLDPLGRAIPLQSVVDTTAHTISAPLPHFSTYAAGVPTAITLNATPSSPVSAGTTVTLTATVTDNAASGVSAAPVTFTTTAGSLGGTSCSTDANGQCSVTLDSAAFAVANVTAGVDALTAQTTVVFQQAWTETLAAGAHTVSLAVSGPDVNVTIDTTTTTRPSATVTSLTIDGSSAGDTAFSVDAGAGALSFPITFSAGAGNDTINGPNADTNWSLTGINAGKLTFGTTTSISFTGTENIHGGTSANAYTFGDTAGVTGAITNANGATATDVTLGGFVHFNGTFAFGTPQLVGVTWKKDDNSTGTLLNVAMTTVGISSGSAFIGAAPGTAGAAGLQGTIQQLALALFVYVDTTTPSNSKAWEVTDANLNASVYGISGLTLSATGLSVSFNGRASDGSYLDLSKLNLSNAGTTFADPLTVNTGGGTMQPNFNTAAEHASVALASFGVGSFVLAQGGFSLDKSTVNVTDPAVAGGAATSASLLDIKVTNAAVFVGSGASFSAIDGSLDTTGAVGFSASGINFEGAVVKPVSNDAGDKTSFTGVQATVASVGLVGISHLTATVANFTGKANQATNSSGGDGTRLNWTNALSSNPAGTVPTFTMSSTDTFSAAGDIAINLAGVLSGSATIAITRTLVDVSTPLLNAAPLLAGTLTVDPTKSQQLTLGTSAFGVSLTAGTIKIASLTDPGTSGDSWFGLAADQLAGSLAGPGLAGGVSAGLVQLNQASGTGASPLDWNEVSGSGLTLSGAQARVAGDLSGLDLFGIVSGSASFDVNRTLVTTATPNPQLTDAYLLAGTFSVNAAKNQGLTLGNIAFGLSITSGTIKFANLTDPGNSGDSWFGVSADQLTTTLTGPELSATVTNGLIQVNQASGPSATPLTWSGSGVSTAGLTLSGSLARVAGDVTQLDAFGIVSGSASFDVSRTLVTMTGPNLAFTNAPLLAGNLTVDSAKSQHLTLGTAAFGLTVTDVTLKFGALSQPGSIAKSWIGLDAENLSAQLAGPGLTAGVTGGKIQLNQGIVNEHRLITDEEADTPPLDWTQSELSAAGLTLKGDLALVSGTLTNLDAFEVLTGSANFSVSRTLVNTTSPVLLNAPLLTGSLSIATGEQLRLGTGAFGVTLTAGTLHLASLKDPGASGQSWFGLDTENLGGQLVAPGVSATLTNGMIQLNQASGTGATALDWRQSSLADAGLILNGPLATVAGDLSNLDIFKLVTGSASFSLSRTLVNTQSPALTNAPLLTGSLSISGSQQLRLGTAAFGVTLTGGSLRVAALSDPGTSGRSWLGLDAENITGHLVGPGVKADVSNGQVQLNRASGTGAVALDWTQNGLGDAALAMNAPLAHVAGDISNLDVLKLVTGSASFSVTETLAGTSGPNPILTNAPLLYGSLTLSPAKQQQLTLGTDAFGLHITAGTVKFAALTDPGASGDTWLGIAASGLAANLVGPQLTAGVTSGLIELNRASGTGATPLNWNDVGLGDAGLTLSGSLARVAGDVSQINAFGVVTGSASFAVSWTLVSTTNPALTDAPLLSGSLSVDPNKNQQLQLGTSALGVTLTNGTINLASLSDPAVNPAQAAQVRPAIVQPGPRVDVITTVLGGKSVSVQTLRIGTATLGQIDILTVRAASGTYALSGGGGDTAAVLAWDASSTVVQGALNGLASVVAACGATCVTVAPMVIQPEGNVYWITFQPSASNVPTLTGDGSLLAARNELQQVSLWNANGGTFAISDGAHSATISYDLSNLASALAGTTSPNTNLGADVKIAGDPPGNAPNNGFFTIEFSGPSVRGRHVNPLIADASHLVGALDNGKLVGDAHFGAILFNQPSYAGVIAKEAAASVNVTVLNAGGAGSNAIQAITVNGAVGGYYQLTFAFNFTSNGVITETTNPISALATAADVEAALAELPNIGGLTRAHNVAVSQTGSTYLVAFTGGPLANTAVNSLVWADEATNHLIAQDQEQIFQILNATTGTFKLNFALHLSGNTIAVSTAAINYPASAGDVKAALETALHNVVVGSTPLAATVTAAQVGNTYIVDLHLSGTLDGNAHDTSFDRDTTFDGNAPAFDAIAPQVIDRRVSTVSSSSADCGTDQPGAQTQHWALIPGVKSGTIDVATIGLNPVSYTSVTGGAPEAGDTFVIDSLANQELVTVLTVSQSQAFPNGFGGTYTLQLTGGLAKGHAAKVVATAALAGAKLGVFDLPVNAGANTFIDTVVTGGAPFKYETLILDSGLGTREPVIVSDVQASGGNWAVKIIGTLRFNHPIGALVTSAMDPTTLEGTVTYSKLAWDDTFWDHYTGDGNFFVYPDAAFVSLMANPGNFDHGDGIEKGRIEVEWDRAPSNGTGSPIASGAFPTWVLPVEGDWVHVVGALICDCGHPEGGFRSEVHPPRLIMTLRDVGSSAYGGAFGRLPGTAQVVPGFAALGPVQATRADIFGSSNGSKARLQENCFQPITLGVPGAVLFGNTNSTANCLYSDWYQPLAFDSAGNAAIYQLFVPAPAKPDGNFALNCSQPIETVNLPAGVVRAMVNGTSVVSVAQSIDPANPGCNVTIDFTGFTEPASHLYGIGAQVYAFWAKPVAPRHVRVVIDSYNVTRTLTNGDWSISALVNDQFSYEIQTDAVMQAKGASNGWSRPCMPYNTGVQAGQSYAITAGPIQDARCGTFDITKSFDLLLLPGQPLRFFARAVQYQIFDPALLPQGFAASAENKDLGTVEHIFTEAENYGIGNGRIYTEVFQDHTSSGNEARFHDCSNGCGSITFHIEDATLGVQPAPVYTPTRRLDMTAPPDKFVVDVSGLRNTSALGNVNVTLLASATQSFNSPADLAQALQGRIDSALLQAGLTPGFTTTGALTAGQTFTAQQVPFGAPVFVPQGNHTHFGLTGDLSCKGGNVPPCDNPVNGAVQTVVTDPNNASIMWIATVNGGVWRTDNAGAGIGVIPWKPLLDLGPSMSIGALTRDPTVNPNSALAADAVLVAGIGDVSSSHQGSALTGIIRSTDGGNTWSALGGADLAGLTVIGVAARANVIVVATQGPNGGIWRSTDTGRRFYHLSGDARVAGLPAGDAFDLVGDPNDPNRLYAAIAGSGVFTSADEGATWTPMGGRNFVGAQNWVGPQTVAGASTVGQTAVLKLAVHSTIAGTSVYAGVENAVGTVAAPLVVANVRLVALFQWTSAAGAWTRMDTPAVNPGGYTSPSFFSIGADPTNANLVYVGGDLQPAAPFIGNLFRCNAGLGLGGQCTSIAGAATPNVATNHGSAPHADSRSITFDAAGDLIESDDGGIYALCQSANTILCSSQVVGGTIGYWISLNGGHETPHLQVTESYACPYDSVSDIILCGNQDTGVAEQTYPNDPQWRQVGAIIAGTSTAFQSGDGALVGIDDNATPSWRYSASQYGVAPFLQDLMVRTCDANNVCSVGTLLAARAAIGADPNLRANGNPFATDAVGDNSGCPAGAYNGRFVLGTAGQVWESCDHGATVNAVNLPGPIGFVNALAYGGMDGATPHGDVLYAGSESGLYVRPAGSATPLSAPRSATYPGGSPVGIVLDPSHWQTAFITDGSQVFSTTDAGVAAANWTNVTGNLFTLGPGRILSITFVPGAAAGLGALLVGTDTGIFASLTTNLGSWAPFSTTLPRTLVSDMRYSSKNGRNVLVVSAFGRGTWKLSSASQAIFGGSQLFGVAPSDQRFAVDLPLTVSNAGVFTVAATQGQFTIAFDANNDGVIEGSEISLPINLGADADTVRSALEAVPAVGAGNIGVTASGNTYTLTLQGTLAAMSYGLLHANLVVSGVVPRTSTAAPISVTTPLAALRTQDGAGANPEIQRIAVAPAAGTFVLSFNGATTQPLLFSASANDVQVALESLATIGPGNVSVAIAGGAYVVTFSGAGFVGNGQLLLTGSVTYGGVQSTPSPAEFTAAMQKAVNQALIDAGQAGTSITASLGSTDIHGCGSPIGANYQACVEGEIAVPQPNVDADAGRMRITANGGPLTLRFESAIQARDPQATISLATPSVNETFDPTQAPASIGRRLEVNLRWKDTSFQELGLNPAPTAFDYASDPKQPAQPIQTDEIKFTMFVNGTEMPVRLASSNLFGRLDQPDPADPGHNLIDALQAAVDSALANYGAGAFAAGDVTVCRLNDAVDASSPLFCKGSGNRVGLIGKEGKVDAVAVDVPYFIDATASDPGQINGTITELGWRAGRSDAPGRSWFGLDGENLAGHLVGPGLHADVANGVVQINLASGLGAAPLDWNQSALAAAGLTLNGYVVKVAGDLSNLDVFGVLKGGASFSVSRTLVASPDGDFIDAPLLVGSLRVDSSKGQQLTLGTAAFGVAVTSGDLHLATLSEPGGAGRTWFGLDAKDVSGSLTGPGLHADVTNGLVQVNQASGAGATPLDWSQPGLSAAGLSLSGTIARVAGDVSNLDVFGLVSGGASFDVSRTLVSPTDPSLTGAPLLTGNFTIDSGKGQSLQIGKAGFGLNITFGSIAIAALTDGAGASWFGLHGTSLAGNLNIPGVTATVSGLEVKVNQFSGSATAAIDWTQTALASTNIGLSSAILAAEGDLVTVNVFDLLSGSMHFSLSKAPVTLTSPAVNSQPLLSFAFSQLNLAMGTSTFGLSITSGSINAAALSDGSGASWFGLHGTGLSGSLNIPGVSATVSNLEVKVNQFSGTATAAIDWTQAALSSTNVGLMAEILAAEGDLSSLNVFDLLSGSMHFSLSNAPVALTTPAVNNQPLLSFSFSQLNLAIGT
ncbi:MAG: hypothetical protein E6I81_04345, partial [Chloroflexi bacterium]